MQEKLERLGGNFTAFDITKTEAWIRREFNQAVANVRTIRKGAQIERSKNIKDDIYSVLLNQDMSREKMLKEIEKSETFL